MGGFELVSEFGPFRWGQDLGFSVLPHHGPPAQAPLLPWPPPKGLAVLSPVVPERPPFRSLSIHVILESLEFPARLMVLNVF